jgi:hypothetical protein
MEFGPQTLSKHIVAKLMKGPTTIYFKPKLRPTNRPRSSYVITTTIPNNK